MPEELFFIFLRDLSRHKQINPDIYLVVPTEIIIFTHT